MNVMDEEKLPPWEGKYFKEKFDEIKKMNEKFSNSENEWRSDPYNSMYYLLVEIERRLKLDYENG